MTRAVKTAMRRGVLPGIALCCGDGTTRCCTTPHRGSLTLEPPPSASNVDVWSDIAKTVLDHDPALYDE
eukprot:8198825-Lingulodinium_polyedra.AAC.1